MSSFEKNEFIEIEHDIWQELNDLGLSPGISFFLQGVKITKQKGFTNFNVACKWKRKIQGIAPKEGWFIATNLATLELAITGLHFFVDRKSFLNSSEL